MKIKEAIIWAENELSKIDIPDLRASIEILLSVAVKKPRSNLLLYPERELTKNEEERFRQMVKERKQFCPVSYIIKDVDFYNSNLYVDGRVLIPRPETELLVEKVKEHLQQESAKKLSILDLGTGSGAIIISLAKIIADLGLKADLKASDISVEALKVAKKNAIQALKNNTITFVESDLLAEFEHQHFDYITANLPYLPSREINNLAADLRYEPRLALDGGRDGLRIYRRLIKELNHLSGPLTLFCEITVDQGESLQRTVKQYLKTATIEIYQDYAKIDRIAIIKIR